MAVKKSAEEERNRSWATALRLLTRRDYSRTELQQKLLAREYDPAQIEATIERCQELGYLDDQRYAFNRARSLMTQGRAVGRSVVFDLKKHGISEELAMQAVEQLRKECEETQLLASLLKRRFPNFNYNSAPAKDKRRVVHFLQRRGFNLGDIMDQLTRKGPETHHEDRQ